MDNTLENSTAAIQINVEWEGIAFRILYTENKFASHDHVEVYADEPLPITETGYKSMFQPNGFWENIAAVEQYFMSWIRSEAKSKAWIARVEEQRQPDLFAALA